MITVNNDDLIIDKASGSPLLCVADYIHDMDGFIGYIKENEILARSLLSCSGRFIYISHDERLGVRHVPGTRYYDGQNTYGKFLSEARSRYIDFLRQNPSEEVPVERNDVKVDYRRDDISTTSEDETQDKDIMIDPARLYNRGFRNKSDIGVPRSGSYVCTFECPFGTSKDYRIQVQSIAEAALYYEQGLRGELDYPSLFRTLRTRGQFQGRSDSWFEGLEKDLRSQFKWIREQIIKGTDALGSRVVVTDSLLASDGSYGRTIFDPVLAPCPAHVLARYMKNPFLFFTDSLNGVAKALEEINREDAISFSNPGQLNEISILVLGSDTIGGRIPGTRAVDAYKVDYRRDANGNLIYDSYGKRIEKRRLRHKAYAFKSDADKEADYLAFSSRLDEIIVNIASDTKIQFVTGLGIGTPQMVSRYIREKGGSFNQWSFDAGKAYAVGEKGKNTRFSLLTVESIEKFVPLLARRERYMAVESRREPDKLMELKAGDVSVDGCIVFSVPDDQYNTYLLRNASLIEDAGIPTVHVYNNMTEKEQRLYMASEVLASRSELLGNLDYEKSLFGEDAKKSWDMDNSFAAHVVKGEDAFQFIYPAVSFHYDNPVYVEGQPFHTVYGAYMALLLKESNLNDAKVFRRLLDTGEDMLGIQNFVSELMDPSAVNDFVMEKCARNAVHLMAKSNMPFSEYLFSMDAQDIVMSSSFGDPRLFVSSEGVGLNMFGVIFSAEREAIREEMALVREKAEIEGRKIAEKNQRERRTRNKSLAVSQKDARGLPSDVISAENAIWFMGTAQPLGLVQEDTSFDIWYESGAGIDVLNRELASRAELPTEDGGVVQNNYIFLFPSDMMSVSGVKYVRNYATSRNLTGVTRVDPTNGERFVCAYGIPVKYDSNSFELGNSLGMKCSYLLDADSQKLLDGIIHADAMARSTAISRGMKLCYSAYETRGGETVDVISRVFNPEVWDYPRTNEVFDRNTGKTLVEGGVLIPTEEVLKVKNMTTGKYERVKVSKPKKQWIPNPHASARNKAIVLRYEDIIQRGVNLPLNCICLPKEDYTDVSESEFIADLNMTLSVANANAVALGVPLKFGLDKEGKINLGGGVPENLRKLAEAKIDSFIGVVKAEEVEDGELMELELVDNYTMYKVNRSTPLLKDGSEIMIRPNSLLSAFGPFDFSTIEKGSPAPIHEMCFRSGDDYFKIVDPRISSRMPVSEINKYLSYSKNDECRFIIWASRPESVLSFKKALRTYTERAGLIGVEYRLMSEEEMLGSDESLSGFVKVLSSNSDEMPVGEHEIAARPAPTALELPNNFDATDSHSYYAGKVDANDGFEGYVQYRYSLPGAEPSEWITLRNDNLELVKDLVMSKLNRVYCSDTRIIPSKEVLEASLRCLAVRHAGEQFRTLNLGLNQITRYADDKIVGTIGETDDVIVSSSRNIDFSCRFIDNLKQISDLDSFTVYAGKGCPKECSELYDVVFESLDDCLIRTLSADADKFLDSFEKLSELADGKMIYIVNGTSDLYTFLKNHGCNVTMPVLHEKKSQKNDMNAVKRKI